MSKLNTIAYNERLSEELDKKLVTGSATGFFADNGLKAKFVGAKTVLIPEVDMQALGDYDRETGFVSGSVSVTHTPHQLAMDRGRSFMMDAEDSDETGIANLQGQVMSEFVRTKVIPEMDAYVLSKLAGLAVLRGQTVSGTPATQALAMLNAGINGAYNNGAMDEEMVAFVSMSFWAALTSTAELTRMLTVADFEKGDIKTKVKSYNGCAIIPVPESRMKTAFKFLNGKEEEVQGGFVPGENAKSVGLIVLPKKAVSLIKKTEKTRTFTPEQNIGADAWKSDYRVYYDIVVKNSYAPTVFAYVYDSDSTGFVSEANGSNAQLYGKTLADLQSSIIVDDGNGIISGQLKKITDYGGGSGFDASKGTHFLAIQVNNVPTGYTAKIKLTNGEMDWVQLLSEEDYSAVLQLNEENKTSFQIKYSKDGAADVVKTYRISGLLFE